MRLRPANAREVIVSSLLVACAAATALTATDVARSMSANGLSYPEADRLVTLVAGSKSWSPAMLEIARDIDVFEQLSGIQERSATIQWDGQAELVRLESVSSPYFELLGISPTAGRVFSYDEDQRNGSSAVAVISHRLWQRRFGGDPSALGQSVLVDGHRLEIIGILPARSAGLIGRTDIWTPLGSARWLSGDTGPERPSSRWFEVFGRLKAGIDVETATARFAATMPGAMTAAGLPAGLLGSTPRLAVTQLSETRVPPIGRRAAPILNWAAASLCLFVFITVSSLLFLRANRRSNDISVKIALGATPAQLVRPALAEAFLISGIAIVIALGIRPVLTGALTAVRPTSTSFGIVTAEWLEVAPVFTLKTLAVGAVTLAALLTLSVISMLTTIARARRRSLRAAQSAEGLGRLRTPVVWLVAAQVGLACMVVAGGLLMTIALARVLGSDRGYRPVGVFTARLSLPEDYDAHRTTELVTRLAERLTATPGVEAVSFATCAPGAGRCRQSNIASVDGSALPRDASPQIGIHVISSGHFRTIGAQITRGRGLDAGDSFDGARSVVVTDVLADRLWPGTDPIGHQLEIYTANGALNGSRTVVGTLRPVQFNVDDDPGLDVFLPVAQAGASSLIAFIKGTSPMRDRLAVLARETADLDSRIPVYDPMSMEDRLARSLAAERLLQRAFTGFGAVSLLLALLGAHTLTTQAVVNAQRELAVRMALGATSRHVSTLVARRVVLIAALGCGAGTLLAFAGSRVLTAMLHGMPHNHVVLLAAPLVTGCAMALAIVAPIRRASRVSVLLAMRES